MSELFDGHEVSQENSLFNLLPGWLLWLVERAANVLARLHKRG